MTTVEGTVLQVKSRKIVEVVIIAIRIEPIISAVEFVSTSGTEVGLWVESITMRKNDKLLKHLFFG